MWREKHLKAVPPVQRDEAGQEVLEIGAHRQGILEELEKAHVYIAQLHEALKAQQAQIKQQQDQIDHLQRQIEALQAP